MKRINITELSSVYRVRFLSENDIEEILRLSLSNPQYYRYHSVDLSREQIAEDMTILPEGKTDRDKYYVGYYDEHKKLIAVLDLIDGYPAADAAYIGLFMVDAAASGKGVGTAVIGELCDRLSRIGFGSVRLAYGKQNPQSSHFWQKNGFVPVKEADHEKYGHLIVAERSLTDLKPYVNHSRRS